MKIFYTQATEKYFSGVDSDSTLISRIHALLGNNESSLEAMALAHQTELFRTLHFSDDHYDIHWLGVRISDSDRLLGAVVRCKDSGKRYFFALETTPHDYQKTLVENKTRLCNWRKYMTEYLQNCFEDSAEESDKALASGSDPEPVVKKLFQHGGHFGVLNTSQEALLALPLHKGGICFGGPGSGKSCLSSLLMTKYTRDAALKTLVIVPNKRLQDAVVNELSEQGLEEIFAKTMSRVWSEDDFFIEMAKYYPDLNLSYTKEDSRTRVDFSHFKSFLKANRTYKSLDIDEKTLWQDFSYVWMQPDWTHTDLPHCSVDTYESLGVAQSSIEKAQRRDIHEKIYTPFFNQLSNTNEFYFLPYMAYLLYQRLSADPRPSILFDATLIDEIQLMHPWVWASVLQLRSTPLGAGQFFICGDAHQGGEHQALRVSERLRSYFEAQSVDVSEYSLSVNHRSTQGVAQFVKKLHQLELTVLGSIERRTHIEVQVNPKAERGSVELRSYTSELASRMAGDAGVYVLIPNESMRAQAELRWAKEQIVTLREFSGMSANTLVMFLFSTRWLRELNDIAKACDASSSFVLEEDQSYARKSKGLGEKAVLWRECVQSLYMAASRAANRLIIVEEGRPHRLLQFMDEAAKRSFLGTESSSSSCYAAPGEGTCALGAKEAFSTPADWFQKAREDYKRGLKQQAIDNLCNEKRWGLELITKISPLFSSPLSETQIFEEIHRILFEEKTNVLTTTSDTMLLPEREPSTETSAAACVLTVSSSAMLPDTPAPKPLKPLGPKRYAFLQKILDNPTAYNFQQIVALAKGDTTLLAQLLFTHRINNTHCLFVCVILSGKGMEFYSALKADWSKIQEAYTVAKESDLLLRLCFEEINELNAKISSDRHERRTSRRKKQSKPQKHAAATLIEQVVKTAFLFNELLRDPNGLLWFTQRFSELKDLYLFKETLHQIITTEGPYQGTSPFYAFLESEDGIDFIEKYWDYLLENEIISERWMHLSIESLGPFQGATPFFALAKTTAGSELIEAHWMDFVKMNVISSASMHRPITGEGPDQGKTPLYCLTSHLVGINLIEENWEYFIQNNLISSEAMHREVTGNGREHFRTPFYCLLSSVSGCELITDHWKDFKHLGLLDLSDTRLLMIIKDGPFAGKTMLQQLQQIEAKTLTKPSFSPPTMPGESPHSMFRPTGDECVDLRKPKIACKSTVEAPRFLSLSL